jgi:Zn-dependent M28 family amino/carboxypeptidase
MRRAPFAFTLALALAAPLASIGCGDSSSSNSTTTSSSSSSGSGGSGGGGGVPATYTDPAAVQARLGKTLNDLAAMGSKRSGTTAGNQAGDYVKQRFADAGYPDASFESFDFLSFDLKASSLAVTIDGAAAPMKHDVFQYSGKGHVDADIVDVGTGHLPNYSGLDVTGKIVLVTRDPTFHREAQYKIAAQQGAAAMLYVSQAPQNLIQIGTVADPEDGLATIPTITVGADDGQTIKDALAANGTAHAVIDVDAAISPATGRNVIARLSGTDPSGAYVVVGAHYDTWYTGSTDNSAGVAMLLELAEAMAHGPKHKLGVVFVGYDGEELGLFGGYDYLRRHVLQGNEPMLAFVNLEMPGASTDPMGTRAMAHTNDGPIVPAVVQSETNQVYTLFVGMELVPGQFGGLIPTDIQGMYWSGLQGLTTYCDTPYYHTTEDTPDKLDMGFLAQGSIHMARLVETFDQFTLQTFHKHDSQTWSPTVKTTPQASGDLLVDVEALDAYLTPQADAQVIVWVDVDDFTRAFKLETKADSAGKASVTVPKSALTMGKGKRWLHVTTGQTYPLAERLSPLP